MLGKHSRRHQIYRSARRFGRVAIWALLLAGFIAVSYLNIHSGTRLRQSELVEWNYNTSRDISKYVLPENDTTLLEPQNICEKKLFLLIVVCSRIDNFDERQNIRQTWGNTTEFNYNMFPQIHSSFKGKYLEPNKQCVDYYRDYLNDGDISNNLTVFNEHTHIPVRVVFLIGSQKYEQLMDNETHYRLRNEVELYNDIVQEDFVDSYKNLTIKTVMALKWVMHRCSKSAAFVMKCDDDTFVNVPNLLHFLLGGTIPRNKKEPRGQDRISCRLLNKQNRYSVERQLLLGYCYRNAHPIANVAHQWYMPAYMFPDDTYPDYLSGSGYVMSIDVVSRLYTTALNTSLIYLEDVYLTGVCAKRAHIHLRHSSEFVYVDRRHPYSYKSTFTQHYTKGDDMLDVYALVTNGCDPVMFGPDAIDAASHNLLKFSLVFLIIPIFNTL